MKLLVPHFGTPQATDARLMRLAGFLGITCEPLSLHRRTRDHAEYMAKVLGCGGDCVVVNPQVMREWTGSHFPRKVVSYLTSRFPYLFVHGLTPDAFCEDLIKALSGDHVQGIRGIIDSGKLYDMASNTGDVCGPFSGISFGPVNLANDYTLLLSAGDANVRTPISIGGNAFMAAMKRDRAEIVFLAGADILDLNELVGDIPLSDYFSRFLPHAMALRYMFGEQCWHPSEHLASFIIDDPLLRPKYGCLDYASLLDLMNKNNFSSTVAFIPHNYRRNSKRTVEMFRESGGRLAICFHGNDHTAAELASADTSRLNTMLRIAEARMDAHTNATGLPCPKVMVFPQDNFSVEAMKVLKSRNFCAAVCGSPHPAGGRAVLTLGECAQPAILQHGQFPLFFRKCVGQVKKQEVAFNLFFGQPVLLVEHHGLFKQANRLLDDVATINSVWPAVRWCDLATAVLNSTLRRNTPDGICHVRAYSGAVHVANDWNSPRRFLLEWSHSNKCPALERILQDGAPVHSFEVADSAIRLSVELESRSHQTFSLAFRNDYASVETLGFAWSSKAFIRRRLSEVRDNYISNNGFAMTVAQALRRRILPKTI